MKKVLPTYDEDPELWDNFAEKHQGFLVRFKALMEKGCMYCKKKFPSYPEMSFHIRQTHGIDKELLFDLLNARENME